MGMDACDGSFSNKKLHTYTYVPSYGLQEPEKQKGCNSSVFYTFLRAWVGTWAWIIGVSTVVASEV